MAPADRELILAHAALLTHANVKQTKAEETIPRDISEYLGFVPAARAIREHAKERADKSAGKG